MHGPSTFHWKLPPIRKDKYDIKRSGRIILSVYLRAAFGELYVLIAFRLSVCPWSAWAVSSLNRWHFTELLISSGYETVHETVYLRTDSLVYVQSWPSCGVCPARCLSVTFVYCVETAKRYGHSCYGMRTGNRANVFEWYQFEWPPVTYNPDFELFNAEYLRNGMRYNGKLIGTYTCLTRMTLGDFEWLSEIFSDIKHYAASLQ